MFVRLIGESGLSTERLELDDSLTRTEQLFSRGSTDVFVVKSIDVGVLSAIEVGHDNRGPNPNWYLSRVVVANERSGDKATFQVRSSRSDL